MRKHPGRTLEDYDRYHVERREDTAHFWRDFKRTDRQEAIARRRYSLACIVPPSPLQVVYNISSDDELSFPRRPRHRGGLSDTKDVIYL